MNIAIGNDHAGTQYKNYIVKHLETKGYTITNFGTDTETSVDYPDFVHPVANNISDQLSSFGILICGSGNGVAITANKHAAVRAALCWTTEIAALARQHNNANIICIPARFTALEQVIDMINTFLNTPFNGGRHERRINKIPI